MKKNRILYIEDEPILSRVVKDTLEHQGFEVLHFENGLNIQKEIDGFNPDICILDVMLPLINGFELGKQIRERYPDLPFIFVTAKSFTDDVLEGFNSGANDYVKKPFSIEELIARINNQLNKTKLTQENNKSVQAVLKIGNYTFSPSKMELIHENQVIKLSYKENQILEILYANINKITERKQILLAVWGDDSYYNSRNLDVYILKLRQYLSKDQIEIKTLKGIGYMFQIS